MPLGSRMPRHGAAAAAAEHLRLMRRAVSVIEDAGVDLDRWLAAEGRPGERLRLLRQSTRVMTQAGNDAVLAYRRGIRALDGNHNGVSDADRNGIRDDLLRARRDLLLTLEIASRRYPWAPSPLGSLVDART
jgi:hypothetical protein